MKYFAGLDVSLARAIADAPIERGVKPALGL